MSNPTNSINLIGRLAADPKVFTNSDGSKKVSFTLMIDRNYADAQGNYGSDAVPVEAFVRKTVEGTGPFAHVHKGDLVTVDGSLRQDRFMKGGVEQFVLKAIVENISFLESRSVTQARLAERVAKAEAEQKTLAAGEPAVAEAATADLPY